MPKHHSFGPPTHRPHTQAETRTSLPYNHAQRAHVKEMYVCMWWRACVYNSEHKHVDVGPDVLVDFLWGLLHWMVWLPARQVAHASPLHSITGTIAIANPLRVSLTLASVLASARPLTDRPTAGSLWKQFAQARCGSNACKYMFAHFLAPPVVNAYFHYSPHCVDRIGCANAAVRLFLAVSQPALVMYMSYMQAYICM